MSLRKVRVIYRVWPEPSCYGFGLKPLSGNTPTLLGNLLREGLGAVSLDETRTGTRDTAIEVFPT